MRGSLPDFEAPLTLQFAVKIWLLDLGSWSLVLVS